MQSTGHDIIMDRTSEFYLVMCLVTRDVARLDQIMTCSYSLEYRSMDARENYTFQEVGIEKKLQNYQQNNKN